MCPNHFLPFKCRKTKNKSTSPVYLIDPFILSLCRILPQFVVISLLINLLTFIFKNTEQRHREEFISTVCVLEGRGRIKWAQEVIGGSKGTINVFHAKTERKEPVKIFVSLPLKTLTKLVVSYDTEMCCGWGEA